MRSASSTAERILQIKVTLCDIRPPIWRRIAVPATTMLSDLHEILQVVMGWNGHHLHGFRVGDRTYGPQHEWQEPDIEDEGKAPIGRVLRRSGGKLRYDYDFGDGWVHDVVLERSVIASPEERYPRVLTGRRRCPPEDVGGWHGYEEFVEAMRNRNHSKHRSMRRWFGGPFDPEAFDVAATNRALRRRRSPAS